MSGIVREVTIGECRLILGDCREVLPGLPVLGVLCFHVARLAKADKIFKFVRIFRRAKQPERNYVMNWNGVTDRFFALLANPTIPNDCGSSCRNPSFPPVGCYPADPLRGIFSRKVFCNIFAGTCFRAKAKPRLTIVLSGNPRLYKKLIAALRAIVRLAFNGASFSDLLSSERVGRPHSLPVFVPNLMSVRHSSDGHVPLAAANKAAKPSLVSSVWLYVERFATDFAGFCNHGDIIPQHMGAGTTGVACALEGRRFIGVEIVEEAFYTACERIENAYRQAPMFPEQRQAAPHQNSLLEVTA